jgi:hypothetical protein
MSEIVERLEGAEGVERYGVCDCASTTIQTQVWLLLKVRRPPDARGTIHSEVEIVCGLCTMRRGWLEDIIGPRFPSAYDPPEQRA